MRIVRWLHLFLIGGMLGVVGVLSLSDSIVGPVHQLIRRSFNVAAMVGPAGGLGNPGNLLRRIPVATDSIGHFLLWLVVGLVACGLVKGLGPRLNLLLALFALSGLIEVAQQYLSWSRSAEFEDLVANGFGLVVAFAAYGMAERCIRGALRALGRDRNGPPAPRLRSL